MHFVFGNGEAVPAVVQWIHKDEMKLVFGDGGNALVLRRMGVGLASPFKKSELGEGQPRKGAPSKLETVQP